METPEYLAKTWKILILDCVCSSSILGAQYEEININEYDKLP